MSTPQQEVQPMEVHSDDSTIHEQSASMEEEDRKSSTNEKEKDQVELKESATVDNVKQVGVDDYPDGGLRAWLVVFGAASGTFATFGYVNAWGVFQAYYEQNTLSNTDPSTIAWIGSIEYALIFIPGLLSGRLFDMGHFKIMLLVSSAIVVTATFLIAQCKEYWQFLLCQGFAVGLACGCIFGPMLGVVAHWFKYKRGVALGVVAIGSSIGGTIFPIAARKLIPLVGFQWTMRILGFIQLAALGVTNLTLERRLPPKTVVGPFINLNAFRNKAYTMYCFSSLVAFLGLYTVLTYIDISASAAGVSDDFSFYLVSIANASSGLGRIAGGFLADSSGSLNVLAPATFIAAILTYAWPFAKSQGAFVAIAVIYGIASGVYVSLLPAPVMQMGQTHDVGVRVGMLMTVLAFGAVAGPPISGAINTATGGFDAVGYYAGSTVIVAVIMMVSTKYLQLGTLRGKF